MSHHQRLAVYDALNACVRYLSETRSRGRFELFLAVKALNEVVNPVPLSEACRIMRDATLAIGRMR